MGRPLHCAAQPRVRPTQDDTNRPGPPEQFPSPHAPWALSDRVVGAVTLLPLSELLPPAGSNHTVGFRTHVRCPPP
jgi:hypothetical protein